MVNGGVRGFLYQQQAKVFFIVSPRFIKWWVNCVQILLWYKLWYCKGNNNLLEKIQIPKTPTMGTHLQVVKRSFKKQATFFTIYNNKKSLYSKYLNTYSNCPIYLTSTLTAPNTYSNKPNMYSNNPNTQWSTKYVNTFKCEI
jgi:hypothetical protein